MMMHIYLIWLTCCSRIIAASSSSITRNAILRKVKTYTTYLSAINCKEVWVARNSSTSLSDIAVRFQTNTSSLLMLNPNLSLAAIDTGTPVCVAGNIIESGYQGSISTSIGGRDTKLSTYLVSPSMGTNCTSIVQHAQPYLSPLQFLELNPALICTELASEETTIYLPYGTTIQPDSNVSISATEGDQDCIVGPWGDWTDCGSRNVKARYRNVYQEATGNGAACPYVYESQICNTTNSDTVELQSVTTCPSGINGCSVPWQWTYYNLFTPACNVHDICYVCNQQAGWEFATKSYCDNMFKSKMISLCDSYWSGRPFDLSWCSFAADAYYMAVKNFGGKFFYKDSNTVIPCEADSCFSMPWSSEMNNVGPNMGFYPEWSGCPCIDRSCDYIYD
jgi:hypothetical protein